MPKQVHKFLIVIILSCVLSTPAISVEQADSIPVSGDVLQNDEVELIQDEVRVEDSDIEPINTGKLKESVVPDPSREGKKVIGLFLKTMMAVAFCTVLIYFIALFAKKFYFNNFSNVDSEELDSLDLSTPNSKNDALKSFLNRTK